MRLAVGVVQSMHDDVTQAMSACSLLAGWLADWLVVSTWRILCALH